MPRREPRILRIEVEWIQAGQPRAYADSVYEAKISFMQKNAIRQGEVTKRYVTEDEAKKIAQMFVRPFHEGSDRAWHHAKLAVCAMLDAKKAMGAEKASQWRVKIVEPYKD